MRSLIVTGGILAGLVVCLAIGFMMLNGWDAMPSGQKNSIGMEMVPISAGTFEMGSHEHVSEKKPHQVTIRRKFFIAAHKTTQAEFAKVMDRQPSYFSPNGGGKELVADLDTDHFPVEQVTFFDAVEFCNKLSKLEGREPCYSLSEETIQRGEDGEITAAEVKLLPEGTGYRLPTEAEWEYCARAGTRTRYSFGDTDEQLEDYAWYDKNSDRTTHPVDDGKTNPWGLHQMGGNVFEWCEDNWHDNYEGAPDDGSPWLTGGEDTRRVVRGGCWGLTADRCRPASRDYFGAGIGAKYFGFRVVRVSP
jgi:formylglycine-generating enzyme required for sulfatase activity